MESYEDRLNRLFSGWTDDEVASTMHAVRDSKAHESLAWDAIWREYARRNYSDDVVCHRCGSENHGTIGHDEHAS